MTSRSLSSPYNNAVSKAYYGHLGWAFNLGIQFYVGHNQLAPWACNIAMVPCAILHLACAWGVYGRGSASFKIEMIMK